MRNIGQWSNGWTSNLKECIAFASQYITRLYMISTMSNKILVETRLWQVSIYVSWPNYVPAVAVIRRRLVLFIFIRFKGYLDGIISPIKGTVLLEFYERWEVYVELEMKFYYTAKTYKGESNHLCNNWRWGTKAWVANRIRYPSSPSRKLWMP